MDLKDLKEIGSYLYGYNWKCFLAKDLSIGDSTLRAICGSRRKMKEETEQDVYRLVATYQLAEIIPLLKDIASSGGLPSIIKLTPIKKKWSLEADIRIKQLIVQHLNKHGINCEVANIKGE